MRMTEYVVPRSKLHAWCLSNEQFELAARVETGQDVAESVTVEGVFVAVGSIEGRDTYVVAVREGESSPGLAALVEGKEGQGSEIFWGDLCIFSGWANKYQEHLTRGQKQAGSGPDSFFVTVSYEGRPAMSLDVCPYGAVIRVEDWACSVPAIRELIDAHEREEDEVIH